MLVFLILWSLWPLDALTYGMKSDSWPSCLAKTSPNLLGVDHFWARTLRVTASIMTIRSISCEIQVLEPMQVECNLQHLSTIEEVQMDYVMPMSQHWSRAPIYCTLLMCSMPISYPWWTWKSRTTWANHHPILRDGNWGISKQNAQIHLSGTSLLAWPKNLPNKSCSN